MISNRHSAIESNNAFTAKVEDLVREIVIQNNILYYRIESSVEHLASSEGNDSFMPVIRVITYFEDTVSQIADLLNTEFEIVSESSVDKKKSRIESFSYKHIQYLVGLKANRKELIEYKRSGDKKFEVQICSMLQDAWAGIEKELGYDSASFPEEGKRDLYRVGALLEMADLEFLKIRSKFLNRQNTTQQQQVTQQANDIEEETYTAPVQEQVATTSEVIIDDIAEPVAEPQENTPEVAEPAESLVQRQPEAVTPEVMEPVAEQPEPETPAAPPVAEQAEPEAPVMEQPELVTPAAPPVAEQPEPVIPLVRESKVAAVIQGIAPRRVAPEPVPSASAAGLAPKPAKFDVPEIKNEIPEIKENNTSATIAPVKENKTEVVEEKIPEQPKVMPEAIITPEIPVAASIPIPEVPKEVPQAAPPPPVADIKENIQTAAADNTGHTVEASTDNDVPFFEDVLIEEQTKATKPAPLDENAPITDASLKEYVQKSKLLKEIDKQIAERAGAKINMEVDIEGDVERLRFLKVYTLKQLHDRLKDNNEDIVAFAEKWIGKDNGGSFDSGISLFYLEYLLVGKKNDPAFAVEYVVKFISDNDYSARYIIPTYNSIRNTEAPNFSHLTLK